MNRNATNILKIILLMLPLFMGCEHREIELQPIATGALMPVEIRWDKAKISNPAEGVTILIYHDQGALYRRYDASGSYGTFPLESIQVNQADSAFRCNIRVEVGRYHVVVFNETIRPNGVPGVWISGILNERLEALRFRGVDRIETFEAFASEYIDTRTGSTLKSSSGQSIINNPGILAAWRSTEPLIVTPEMVIATQNKVINDRSINQLFEQLMNIHPLRRVVSIRMELCVTNLSHVHPSSFSNTQLQGVATGYFLGQDRYSATPAAHQFRLNSAKYSGQNEVPDTISAQFTSFGRLGDIPAPIEGHRYLFDTHLLLYDTEQGSPWHYIPQPDDNESVIKALPQDITRPMQKAYQDLEEQSKLRLDLSLRLKLNLRIHIPANFEPWDKTQNSFGGQVNDWINENITIRF